MFNWFRKEKSEEKPPRHLSSLFSTEMDTRQPLIDINSILKRSFQKTPADFRTVSVDGKIVTDAKPSPLSEAIGAFAMDSPSAGNPLSMTNNMVEPFSNMPYAQLCWYAAQGFLGYQICAMIAQHWLIEKACTMPARDAMRNGYDLSFGDGVEVDQKKIQEIKKLDKKYQIRDNCVQLVRFNRIFGIRIALPVIDTSDKDFYQNPFNIDGVKPGSYRGISQIDPYWITPELDFSAGSNPAAIDFYEPTWWRVNGKRIHRSHLIVIRNGEVPDVLKPTYLYGGIPLPQKITERVFAAERTANEAPMLAMTKRTTIMKMDISQAMANQQKFDAVMQFYASTRDNYGVKTIGMDDEAEQFDTALGDFDETIMTQYQLVAAIAEVPATKLLGTTPKGFNATGEYDGRSYHQFLESIQEHDMQPLLERHYELMNKSDFGGEIPEFEIKWNPVDSPTAKEQAEINEIEARTAQAYATAGAIDGVDIRAKIISDKNSGFNNLDDRVPEMPGDENEGDGGEDADTE